MATEFEKKKQRHASGESTVSTDTLTNYIPTPPDGGYGWVIVIASFVNHIIVDGIAFTFGVFYLEFLDFFKAGKGQTALVGSLLCGTYLLTGIIASALTNRFGCRPVCIAGSLIASASFVLCTFSPNISVLMVTYGIMAGFGFGLIYLPSVVSVSFYFQKRRSLATGIAVCGAGVGCFIFAPGGRILLNHFDWKNAMYIVAAVVLNSAVCGMLMRPLEPPRKPWKPRRKNVLDRLKERAVSRLRKRQESECSTCAASANNAVLVRLQEIRTMREQALREEDSDIGSDIGSLPNSTLNSRKRLDSSSMLDSQSRLPSRQNSVLVSKLTLEPLAEVEPIEEFSVPKIIIENEVTESHEHIPNGDIEEHNETTTMLNKDNVKDNDESDKEILSVNSRKRSSVDTKSTPLNGALLQHSLLQRLKQESEVNGNATMNGSLPNGLPLFANHCPESTPNSLLIPGCETGYCQSSNELYDKAARRRHISAARPAGVAKADYARPMYRKDIFYSGSIMHIPQFESQPNVETYLRSVTSIPAETPMAKESCLWRCLHIPKAAKDILKEMLDISLLTNPLFIVIAIANALGMLGMYIPFIFMAERAFSLGVPIENAAFLLSVIGITNTIGRLIAGAVGDLKGVNTLLLHNVAVIGCGVSCILNMFCTTYPLMCANAALFGLCVATWISLTSIILCNMLGLEKLTNAFGLLTMVRGMFVIAGPPIAGYIYEATLNFDVTFHVSGALLVVTGLCFCTLHLPYFSKKTLMLEAPDVFSVDFDSDDDLGLGSGDNKIYLGNGESVVVPAISYEGLGGYEGDCEDDKMDETEEEDEEEGVNSEAEEEDQKDKNCAIV